MSAVVGSGCPARCSRNLGRKRYGEKKNQRPAHQFTPTFNVIAVGVMLLEVWLQTLQSSTFGEVSGHSSTTKPPFAPQPTAAVGLEANAVENVEVDTTPVSDAVAVVEHVLALTVVAGRDNTTLGTAVAKATLVR